MAALQLIQEWDGSGPLLRYPHQATYLMSSFPTGRRFLSPQINEEGRSHLILPKNRKRSAMPGHLIRTLHNDPNTLSHLFDTNTVTIIAISSGTYWYVRIQLVMNIVSCDMPRGQRRIRSQSYEPTPFEGGRPTTPRTVMFDWANTHSLTYAVPLQLTLAPGVGNKMYKAFPLPGEIDSRSKDGRTVTITTDDMQKKKNDVKARTTLLLSLSDEHQLRFSKYKTARELRAAILKTFGGNEATKNRKNNLLKQQYGNFKAEGTETLEQTFNRLQVIVSQLQFMDVEIEKDDLNPSADCALVL
nr:hypothetical protein [Tanacetum cinerariifolium]